eukprot:scaffold73306_cov17-Tisochrysis_lutea.AAC.1
MACSSSQKRPLWDTADVLGHQTANLYNMPAEREGKLYQKLGDKEATDLKNSMPNMATHRTLPGCLLYGGPRL